MKAAIALMLLACVLPLTGHPPRSVALAYDADSATLSVMVQHRVSDPTRHHVSRIEVRSGKELLAEKAYDAQETAAMQEEEFSFADRPLKQGTPVTVTAFCNLSGEKSADLEWP